jgi:CAP-Gly domain-containing linker protein 1
MAKTDLEKRESSVSAELSRVKTALLNLKSESQAEIETLSMEREQALRQIDQLKADLVDERRTCDQVMKDREAQKAELSRLTRELSAAAQLSLDNAREIEVWASAKLALENELQDAQGQINSLDAELDNLKKQLALAEDQLQLTSQKHEASELKLNSKLRRVVKAAEDADKTAADEAEKLEKMNAGLKTHVDSLLEQRKELEEKTQSLDAELTKARTTYRELRPKLDELERYSTDLEQKVSDLEKSHESKSNEIASLSQQNKTLTSGIESLTAIRSDLEHELARLKEALQAEVRGLQEDLEQSRDNNDHLVTQMRELSDLSNGGDINADDGQLQDELNSVKEEAESLRQENATLRTSLVQSVSLSRGDDDEDSASRPDLAKRFSEAVALNETLNEIVGKAHDRNRDLDQELNGVRTELVAYKKKAEKRKQQIQVLQNSMNTSGPFNTSDLSLHALEDD